MIGTFLLVFVIILSPLVLLMGITAYLLCKFSIGRILTVLLTIILSPVLIILLLAVFLVIKNIACTKSTGEILRTRTLQLANSLQEILKVAGERLTETHDTLFINLSQSGLIYFMNIRLRQIEGNDNILQRAEFYHCFKPIIELVRGIDITNSLDGVIIQANAAEEHF